MKRLLLATCATVALAAPARAQWAVIDVAKIAQSEIHQFETLAQWGTQAANMAEQIEGGVRRYQMLERTFNAFTHITDLGSAVSALSTVGIRNPLPTDPYTIQNLLSGRGTATGSLSSLASLLRSVGTQNRVYAPDRDAWMASEVVTNGQSLAAAQAVSLQLYQSAQERMQHLPQLQERINAETTPAGREALIARLNAEQSYIQNALLQMQSLNGYMQAQIPLMRQRQEERMQQSIDAAVAQAIGESGPAAQPPPRQLAAAW